MKPALDDLCFFYEQRVFSESHNRHAHEAQIYILCGTLEPTAAEQRLSLCTSTTDDAETERNKLMKLKRSKCASPSKAKTLAKHTRIKLPLARLNAVRIHSNEPISRPDAEADSHSTDEECK